jgi:hypothetical protein
MGSMRSLLSQRERNPVEPKRWLDNFFVVEYTPHITKDFGWHKGKIYGIIATPRRKIKP